MCLPTVYRESKGLPVLEALANAVPVVLPAHGAFPELATDTGGAVLHRPLDAIDLADKLRALLGDPQRSNEMGRAGQRAVRDRYHARAMAERTRQLYQSLMAKPPVGR
jgi:glycosyltransferase involved in cell wall biosynthesis